MLMLAALGYTLKPARCIVKPNVEDHVVPSTAVVHGGAPQYHPATVTLMRPVPVLVAAFSKTCTFPGGSRACSVAEKEEKEEGD